MPEVPGSTPLSRPVDVDHVTVDADRFKAAFRHHAAGVAVVTADVDGPLALTASSVTSVSADPAVLLFSVSSMTGTGRAIATAATAVIHLLDAEDHALAVRCADPSADRFADPTTWDRLPSGEPTFLGPRTVLRGVVLQRLVFGGATVVVLAVTDIIDRSDAGPTRRAPLAYVDRRWHALDPDSSIG